MLSFCAEWGFKYGRSGLFWSLSEASVGSEFEYKEMNNVKEDAGRVE